MSHNHHLVTAGRHRLGNPGLVHCLEFAFVAEVLGGRRKSWLSALVVPARHSWAGLRRRAVARDLQWGPALAH